MIDYKIGEVKEEGNKYFVKFDDGGMLSILHLVAKPSKRFHVSIDTIVKPGDKIAFKIKERWIEPPIDFVAIANDEEEEGYYEKYAEFYSKDLENLPAKYYMPYMFEPVVDDKESQYMILACNINSDDKWIWKWCPQQYNFTLISNMLKDHKADWNLDCIISREVLMKEIERANEWLDGGASNEDKQLHLLRIK